MLRITIDTQKDSHEDLRKVIELLSKLVNQAQQSTRNIFDGSGEDGSSQNMSGVFGGLFESIDAPSKPKESSEPKPKLEFF